MYGYHIPAEGVFYCQSKRNYGSEQRNKRLRYFTCPLLAFPSFVPDLFLSLLLTPPRSLRAARWSTAKLENKLRYL